MKNPRASFIIAFLGVVLILLCSLYLQFYRHLAPCSLCISQRIFFAVIAIILLTAICHRPPRAGYLIYSTSISLFSLIGLYVAGRQIWLQHLPADQLQNCGPSLDILWTHFPLKALQELFTGSAQCGIVTWELCGLSLAGWAFVFFLGLLGWAVYSFFKCFYSS